MFDLHIQGTEHVVEHHRIVPQGDCPVVLLQGGLLITGGRHQVKENTIIGTAGLRYLVGHHFPFCPIIRWSGSFGIIVYEGAVITGNNIYGNDAVPGRPGVTNCGIYNRSSGVLRATNNYCGASTGPGADPADDICNASGSTATVRPFATKEFRTKGHPR
jgi:hypothetical protein